MTNNNNKFNYIIKLIKLFGVTMKNVENYLKYCSYYKVHKY